MATANEEDCQAIALLAAGYLGEDFYGVHAIVCSYGEFFIRAMERPRLNPLWEPWSVQNQVIYQFGETIPAAASAGAFARNVVAACDRMKADLAKKRTGTPALPRRGKALVVE